MFPTLGLFKSIICPEVKSCELPNCLFSHQIQTHSDGDVKDPLFQNTNGAKSDQIRDQTSVPAASDIKRRKLEVVGSQDVVAVKRPSSKLRPDAKAFVGTLPSRKTNVQSPAPGTKTVTTSSQDSTAAVETGRKRVSPPPLASRARPVKLVKTVKREIDSDVKESLNPRMLPHNPAGHATRFLYLKKLHQEMARLNEEVLRSQDAEVRLLHLSDNSLVRLALDEEERIARENLTVYSNVIKLRMVAYKKMKVEEWIRLRLEAKSPKKPGSSSRAVQSAVKTGLQPAEEVSILPRLVARQQGLEKYGYVTKLPTEAEMGSAKAGIEAAAGWEQCDRCRSRFQVFPDRRDDGALTSGGQCTFHWGRIVRPAKDPADAIKGHREATHGCCNEPLGSSGCTTALTHVFKAVEAKRLAAVMPFERTPDNDSVDPGKAVCFDCEMGYTVHGLELIRLSASSWPDGKALIDVLVRPIGAILDLNSRFSGVFPEDFANALPLQPNDQPLPVDAPTNTDSSPRKTLRVVDSPQAARSLLFSYISPTTPLLGHALENDLNTTRIIHPTIIDTVLLFPHPRGLPLRMSLKFLAQRHLEMDIQMGGAAGHDSLEDARATGELVRWRVAREWSKMKTDGWTVKDGSLVPPLAADGSPVPLVVEALRPGLSASPLGQKRKRDIKPQETESEETSSTSGK